MVPRQVTCSESEKKQCESVDSFMVSYWSPLRLMQLYQVAGDPCNYGVMAGTKLWVSKEV